MSKYYKVEDVIDTLAEQWHFEATIDYPYAADDIEEWKENARELFADLPSVVPSRAEGEWIDKGDYAECSNCGAHSGTQYDGVEPIPLKTKFCPDCGAKMKGAEGVSIPYGTLRDIANELKNIRKILEKQSTTERSSKVGEWEELPFSGGIHTCSNCEVPRISSEMKPDYKYCPNCGAKMKGAE